MSAYICSSHPSLADPNCVLLLARRHTTCNGAIRAMFRRTTRSDRWDVDGRLHGQEAIEGHHPGCWAIFIQFPGRGDLVM